MGKVVEVVVDKGYGYIDIGEDEEVHFVKRWSVKL
jgi:hypothetical protein